MSLFCWVRKSAVVVAGVVLAGCASTMRIDSQVQAHALWSKSGSGALSSSTNSYIFERLPSQEASPSNDGMPSQQELEALAQDVLAPFGWQPHSATASHATDGGTPQWRVQVSAYQQTLPRAPWDDPPERLWLRPRAATGTGRAGMAFNGMLRAELPYFVRYISIVVRDQAQGQVVYETQAMHDGRWPNSPALWRAMIVAALQGFPQAPSGVQQVNIDIPR